MPAPQDCAVLIVSGHAPQVITETLYVLVNDPVRPRNPVEVVVLTTRSGFDCIERYLFGRLVQAPRINEITPKDRWSPFCHDVLRRNLDLKRLIPEDAAAGGSIDDIRDDKDDLAFADLCYDTVRDMTRPGREHLPLVGSIAGGRKTMSAHLLNFFSLYARPETNDRPADTLIHVLFDQEDDFPNFFYPGDESHHNHLGPQNLHRIDIPFVRLNTLLRDHPRAWGLFDQRNALRFSISDLHEALEQDDDQAFQRLVDLQPARLHIRISRSVPRGLLQFYNHEDKPIQAFELSSSELATLFILIECSLRHENGHVMLRDLYDDQGHEYEEIHTLRDYVWTMCGEHGEGTSRSFRPEPWNYYNNDHSKAVSELRSKLKQSAEGFARKYLWWGAFSVPKTAFSLDVFGYFWKPPALSYQLSIDAADATVAFEPLLFPALHARCTPSPSQ